MRKRLPRGGRQRGSQSDTCFFRKIGIRLAIMSSPAARQAFPRPVCRSHYTVSRLFSALALLFVHVLLFVGGNRDRRLIDRERRLHLSGITRLLQFNRPIKHYFTSPKFLILRSSTMESVNVVVPKNKTRKPLSMLQPAATDKEMLVGADRILGSTKSEGIKTKQDITETVKKDASKSTRMTKSKAVQTAREEKIKIEVEDLTSDNPSENYWQVVAERRQMALVETLEENKKLVQCIEKLEVENRVYKEIVDEMRILIEVLQEQIEDRNNINNSLDDSTL